MCLLCWEYIHIYWSTVYGSSVVPVFHFPFWNFTVKHAMPTRQSCQEKISKRKRDIKRDKKGKATEGNIGLNLLPSTSPSHLNRYGKRGNWVLQYIHLPTSVVHMGNKKVTHKQRENVQVTPVLQKGNNQWYVCMCRWCRGWEIIKKIVNWRPKQLAINSTVIPIFSKFFFLHREVRVSRKVIVPQAAKKLRMKIKEKRLND